jgi:hypothetical protein
MEMITETLSSHSIHNFSDAVQCFYYLITLAWAWKFEHITLIPTLEGFTIAHIEEHWCLFSKSLIMCKIVLLTQWPTRRSCLRRKQFTVKFETKLFSEIILEDMAKPAVYPNRLYDASCYNGVLLYIYFCNNFFDLLMQMVH